MKSAGAATRHPVDRGPVARPVAGPKGEIVISRQ